MPTEENTSSSGTSSSGGSYIPDYPQADLLQQISQTALGVSQEVYNWAKDQYNKNSVITDQNMNRFIDAASSAGGLANALIGRYKDVFQPQEDALVHSANTINSKDYQARAMGMEEGKVGQAMDASRLNAEADLRSYGIDPSAGRYASLDKIARTQEGAAKAGAGQIAQLNSEAIGRQERDKAIAVGQQLPGQAVNALAQQASDIAGAQNALLANANTGASLISSAAPFLNTASNLKYPPLGSGPSSSKTTSQGKTTKPDPNDPNKKPDPNLDALQKAATAGAGKGPGNGVIDLLSDKWKNLPSDGGLRPIDQDPMDGNNFSANNSEFQQGGGNPGDWATDGQSGPDNQQGGDNPGDWANAYAGFGQDTTGTSGGVNQEQTVDNTVNNYDVNDEFGNSGSYSDTPNNTSDPYSSNQGFDETGFGDSGDWAKGGAVGMQGGVIPSNATTGGNVPRSASPSGGRVTDDVNAHVNAEEFIIPRDVAVWKGQEFFYNLMAKSREARAKAKGQSGGKPGPSRPGPATFRSQAA